MQPVEHLVKAIELGPDDGPDDENRCRHCCDNFDLDDGDEPTALCHQCAQLAAAELPALYAQVDRLRRIIERVGVCPACDGTGIGFHGSSSPDPEAPEGCEACNGMGSKAFEHGRESAESYYRSITRCPKDVPLWEHLDELTKAARAMATNGERT
jgi:hypothetical protein